MNRYRELGALGDGTFGSVFKAQNRATGEIVAIKKMKRKFFSWRECLQLREVRSLRKLSHESIVQLKEVIRDSNELFFVFEHMQRNLYELMKERLQSNSSFSDDEVRHVMRQVLLGLDYMHKHGFFHRDLKPENLLVRTCSSSGAISCKIADFGLAREIRSAPPYTDYVSTRWYRAPEVLLRQRDYSAAVDLWAVGAIMAEMISLRPLFPGKNEPDEVYKICAVLGSPGAEEWPHGHQLATKLRMRWPRLNAASLAYLLPTASPAAIDVMQSVLQWNPKRRATAAQLLTHPYFAQKTPLPKQVPSKAKNGAEGSKEGVPRLKHTAAQIGERPPSPPHAMEDSTMDAKHQHYPAFGTTLPHKTQAHKHVQKQENHSARKEEKPTLRQHLEQSANAPPQRARRSLLFRKNSLPPPESARRKPARSGRDEFARPQAVVPSHTPVHKPRAMRPLAVPQRHPAEQRQTEFPPLFSITGHAIEGSQTQLHSNGRTHAQVHDQAHLPRIPRYHGIGSSVKTHTHGQSHAYGSSFLAPYSTQLSPKVSELQQASAPVKRVSGQLPRLGKMHGVYSSQPFHGSGYYFSGV